jgi:primosomal protein N' (replication factor Y)
VRADGTVIIHADAAHPAVQALIRWDATTFSERTLADRIALSFPPAVRMAAVTGEPGAVASLLAALPPPPPGAGLDTLGPVSVAEDPGRPPGDIQRALLRVPRAEGLGLARALHAAQAARSARKEGGGVRVQLDPAELI